MRQPAWNCLCLSVRIFLTTAAILVLVTPGRLGAQPAAVEQQHSGIEIKRSGALTSREAPAEHFTGQVHIQSLFQEHDPSQTSTAYVTFAPGARSAWHTHPLGQILIVTAGVGRVQRHTH